MQTGDSSCSWLSELFCGGDYKYDVQFDSSFNRFRIQGDSLLRVGKLKIEVV